MSQVQWVTPITASSRRSLELDRIHYQPGGVEVRLVEEDSERRWVVRFSQVQGMRITTFESASRVLAALNGSGGLFELTSSQWLDFLGKAHVEYMQKSRHFVICCYDEVVEIAAWHVDVASDGG